jgi:hypothetical protein
MSDSRYVTIRQRYESLSDEELNLIVENINANKVCFDTLNYNEENHTYCPLAIALNLHNTIENPTDEKIKEGISKRFNPVNIIKGVEGNFFTTDRKSDILNICGEILNSRKQ